jgi:hypothetical protein
VALAEGTARLEFRQCGHNITADATYGEKSKASAFVARAPGVLVIRAEAGGIPLGHLQWELGRVRHPGLGLAAAGAEGELGWLDQPLLDQDHYVIMALVEGAAARWGVAGTRAFGECELDAAGAGLTIYLTVVSSRDAADPGAEARRRLTAAQAAGYTALAAANREWWENYWRRSFVMFGDAEVEKWWYIANYLCGATLRAGAQSPGLQGVWAKENIPGWNGDYHGNINMQSLYWGLLPSNRLDLMEPYFRYYTDILPQCRRDTAEYFRMRGARLPHSSDTSGYQIGSPDHLTLATSPAPSGWLAQLFWQYYEYTGDKQFLAETAYPMLRDVALFYSDYLVKESDGRYAIVPSIYFEVSNDEMGNWGRNSSYDLAIFRMALENAVAAAGILGIDGELQAEWREKVEYLAPLPANKENVWLNWEGKELARDPWHYQCFPVYPAELASKYHGSEALRKQAVATWEYLKRMGRPGAWCGGMGTSTAVRMGDIEWAMQEAKWWTGSANGLVGGWSAKVLQADHGPGMSRALSDMLVLSLGGVVRLFPGTPPEVPARFHSLRLPGAFLVSAEKRGAGVAYAVFQSLAGNELRVANPFEEGVPARIRDLTTGRVCAEGCEAGAVLTTATEIGHVYAVERTAAPLETIEKQQVK